MGECDSRVAIVTGAGRGMGNAIALRLAAEGAAVCVTGRSAEPGSHELGGSLREMVEQINAAGGRRLHRLRREPSCRAAAARNWAHIHHGSLQKTSHWPPGAGRGATGR